MFCSGMHLRECMTGYILIYVAYMYHHSMIDYILVCWVACIIISGLISSIVHSLTIRVYAYVWMVMHQLCMFMSTCGQVYNDVMVVVMHEVVVCCC